MQCQRTQVYLERFASSVLCIHFSTLIGITAEDSMELYELNGITNWFIDYFIVKCDSVSTIQLQIALSKVNYVSSGCFVD